MRSQAIPAILAILAYLLVLLLFLKTHPQPQPRIIRTRRLLGWHPRTAFESASCASYQTLPCGGVAAATPSGHTFVYPSAMPEAIPTAPATPALTTLNTAAPTAERPRQTTRTSDYWWFF